MAQLSDQEQQRRLNMLGEVFRPSAPITDQQLFAGRNHELFSVVEAVQSVGQHAVIFGERGVGKTSLARIAMQIQQGALAVRVNCDGGDTYTSIWDKVLDELAIAVGELPPDEHSILVAPLAACVETLKQQEVTPSSVRVALRRISIHRPVAVFIDEFNEIADSSVRALISNTIKALSDHIERITLCPVGVAEDLDALLEGHLSAVRAIVQVRMPRMSGEELEEIVRRGLERLEMEIGADALNLVRVIPRGLPQYAHLLAQEGARDALLEGQSEIQRDNVMRGLKVGLGKLDHTLSKAYEGATYSPKKTRLKEVLLACAIAKVGDQGDFSPSDIRVPYSKIIKEQVNIDRFNPQLTTLATQRDILVREGEERRWRYRFRDPLMEPYVLLNGLESGAISPEDFPH
jgi:Cdc6-like AAA superfamily ATPase